jgi:hypothetical protein
MDDDVAALVAQKDASSMITSMFLAPITCRRVLFLPLSPSPEA